MNVCLVYVGVGVAGFDPNRPVGDREGSWIGHGIASIGACTKKAGHEVSLIDMRNISGFEELEKMVRNSGADVFGLSVSPVDYYPAIMTAHVIKKVNSNNKVIVGGIHPSIFPERYSSALVDTVVIGEGEIIFPQLLDVIRIELKLPGRVHGLKPNLNDIPWADRELFDYKKEIECNFTPDQKMPSITMLAGRGCPFKCTYCQPAENAVFGKPYRIRDASDVVAEMMSLHKQHGYNSVTFWDDTFTINPKWVEEFCDRYEESGVKASIAACSRADIICDNEDMVERLASVGLDCLVIGLESGSQRILDLIKKGTTVEQNIQAAEICRKYGIKIFGTYMYGLPTETKEEALETAEMINKINPEYKSPFF